MSIQIDANSLVDKKFVGLPWERLGRTEKGVDCIGIVWLYLKANGIDVPDTDGLPIPKDWKKQDAERMLKGVLKYGDMTTLNRVEKFDIVLFSLSNMTRKMPDHIAVMVSHSHFLHITEYGVSQVQGMDMFWRERLVGAVRLHKARSLVSVPLGTDIEVKL